MQICTYTRVWYWMVGVYFSWMEVPGDLVAWFGLPTMGRLYHQQIYVTCRKVYHQRRQNQQTQAGNGWFRSSRVCTTASLRRYQILEMRLVTSTAQLPLSKCQKVKIHMWRHSLYQLVYKQTMGATRAKSQKSAGKNFRLLWTQTGKRRRRSGFYPQDTYGSIGSKCRCRRPEVLLRSQWLFPRFGGCGTRSSDFWSFVQRHHMDSALLAYVTSSSSKPCKVTWTHDKNKWACM